MSDIKFDKIALIGIGLIGSSLARIIREKSWPAISALSPAAKKT